MSSTPSLKATSTSVTPTQKSEITIYTSDGKLQADLTSEVTTELKNEVGNQIQVPFTTEQTRNCLKVMSGNLLVTDQAVAHFLHFADFYSCRISPQDSS